MTTDTNPYETPEANLEQAPSESNRKFALASSPRGHSIGRGWTWIVNGWGIFKQQPMSWVLAMILGFVIMVIVSLVPIVGSIAQMLTTFIWSAGLAIGCRAQVDGGIFEVKHLFSGFQNRPGALILLSVLFNIVIILFVVAALGTAFLPMMWGDVDAMAQLDPQTIMLGALVVTALTIPLMMAVWFAPHLIVFHEASILQAIKMSFVGCLKNVLPFLWWGLVIFVFYVLALLPLLLGLLVIVPVFFTSTYSAYEDIFLVEE